MALGHDQIVREQALIVVSHYINQDALAEEELPADLCRALAALRRAVERGLR